MNCSQCGREVPEGAGFCGNCGQAVGLPEADEGLQTLGGLRTEYVQDTAHRRAEKQAELEPGTIFADRYEIKAVIGRGGMGVVYAAHDNVTDEDVALKLIRRDRLSGPDAVKRLVREGVTTRDIRHPNVVSVYDVGDAGGQPFLSMELLAGQSLRQWIREKARAREDIPFDVASRIVREILEGLKAAHAKGVIHRDLKPENIILLQRPEAGSAPLRIADFGIAQAMGMSYETGATGALGTREYMAPEQITSPDSATESADIYSLSTIFYELLVGVLPQGHWQPPSGGRDDVPPEIDSLIEKGLSNRPMSRPQSADEYLAGMKAPDPRPGDLGGKSRLHDHHKGQDAKPGMPIARYTTIGIAAVVVLGVIGLVYEEDPIGGGSVVIDNNGRDDPDPPPDDPDNPYEYLNGVWLEEIPMTGDIVEWEIDISPNGSLRGEGFLPGLGTGRLQGTMNGSILSYTVTSPAGSFSYTASYDGGCHITVPGVTQLHVNHFPGDPCP